MKIAAFGIAVIVILAALMLVNPIIMVLFMHILSIMVFFAPIIILFLFLLVPPLLGLNDKLRLSRAASEASSESNEF
jgi:hypothetical protein